MIHVNRWFETFATLVQKDMLREFRARRVWPSTLLTGIVLVLILAIHLDIPHEARFRVSGGQFWAAVFFAGSLMVERSFLAERDQGCWRALALYPIAPATIFLAKTTVHVLALCCLEMVLMPVFAALADIPWIAHPVAFVLVAMLANIGFAAVGSLLGALTNTVRQRGQLLVLLLLPLILPVALGAGEATRLLTMGQPDSEWWKWVQVLGVFAVLYTTLGALLSEFVMEE